MPQLGLSRLGSALMVTLFPTDRTAGELLFSRGPPAHSGQETISRRPLSISRRVLLPGTVADSHRGTVSSQFLASCIKLTRVSVSAVFFTQGCGRLYNGHVDSLSIIKRPLYSPYRWL